MIEQIIRPVLLMRSNDSAPSRAILSTAFLGIAYLVFAVLLDWISYVEPYAPFAVTPWNPQTGVSIAFILMFGTRMIPFLFIAPLLADLGARQSSAATDHRALDGGPDRRRLCGGGADPAAPEAALRSGAAIAARSLASGDRNGIGRRVGGRGICRIDRRGGVDAGGGFRLGGAALLGWRCDRHHGRDAVRADLLEAPQRVADFGRELAAGCRHSGCPDARVRLWQVLRRLPADHMDGGAQRDRRREHRRPDHRTRIDPGHASVPGCRPRLDDIPNAPAGSRRYRDLSQAYSSPNATAPRRNCACIRNRWRGWRGSAASANSPPP